MEDNWLGIDLDGRQPKVTATVGHNNKYELDKIAEKARRGLEMVRQGEEDTISGWVMYGEALLDGRRKFPSNEQFGQWKHSKGLCDTRCTECNRLSQVVTNRTDQNDSAAALWAAQEPDELRRILEEYPKIRTVRGAKVKFDEENKPVRSSAPPPPGLRAPTDEEAKRIKNLKDRAASTTSESEKEAVQKKLDKLKEGGIDVDSVMDQKEKDKERDAYFSEKSHREQLATTIAEELIRTRNTRLVRHLVIVAYPETDGLEQFATDYIEG